MKLTARHNDGFTTHLVRWTLSAVDGMASVTVQWFNGSGRETRKFTMPFSDTMIQSVANAIDGLQPMYAGTTDDFPDYELCVESDERMLRTIVYDSIDWDDNVKPEIERFMNVWLPIFRVVERNLALPGRENK
jgi:hypothetical protein